MAVAKGAVVEDFDVVEDIGPGQLPGLLGALSDTLFPPTADGEFRRPHCPNSCRVGSCWALDCARAKSA